MDRSFCPIRQRRPSTTTKGKIDMKKKNFYNNNLMIRAAALLMSVLLAGGSITVQAEEADAGETLEVTQTYVYHQHIGTSDQEGGCYHAPVYHVHTGNDQEYGGCYGIPVYHSHSGDEQSGGICYGTAVLHEHEGDDSQADGCYHEVYHSHESSCYRNVSSSEYGCHTVRTVDTSDGDYEGHDYKYYYMSCGKVIHGTSSSHIHSVLNCNQDNVVVGYELGCGKTEESIEGYLFDCVKTEEDIDSYTLSCNKTTEDIDAYAPSCGKDEETPIGKIILTVEKDVNHKKETVMARFEDLTSGELRLSEEPFTWYDTSGKVLGTGDTMEFYDNGNYSVVLGVTNEDVNRDSLRAGVKVSSIVKPTSKKEGGSSDDGNGEEDTGEQPTVITPTPTPTAIPEATRDVDSDNEVKGKHPEVMKENLSDAEENTQEEPITEPLLRREKRTVTLEEKSSEKEEISEIQTVEPRKSFLGTPAGRLITITAGSLLTLIGLFVVLYLLRWSVAVYNDDGRGNMIYLGRCKVKAEEEGYLIQITDAMAEKSVTNRYCIKPGLFALFRGEEEELLVMKGQKRTSVALDKEMIVVI